MHKPSIGCVGSPCNSRAGLYAWQGAYTAESLQVALTQPSHRVPSGCFTWQRDDLE